LPGKQAQTLAPLSKTARYQAIDQLAEAQKAINALKQLLVTPAQ
jgi:hypothetical protein